MKDFILNKKTILVSLSLLIIVVLNTLLAVNLFKVDAQITDVNLIAREIETPLKLWFNGYFGHFFRFKYLGSLNWLALPFLFAFIINFKSKAVWQRYIFMLYVLSQIFIGFNGFFNSRYLQTLAPITLVFLFISVWNLIEKQELHKQKYLIYFGLFFIVFFNDVLIVRSAIQANNNKPKTKVGFLEARILAVKNIVYETKRTIENKIAKIDSIPYFIKNRIVSIENEEEYVYPTFRFIKYFNTEKNILNNNLPVVYYDGAKKGIYFWAQDDIYYSPTGVKKLMENRTDEEVSTFLIDSLNCAYFVSFLPYNKYSERFNTYVENYCEPVFMDYSEFVFYKIHKKIGPYPTDPIKALINKQVNDTSMHMPKDFSFNFYGVKPNEQK